MAMRAALAGAGRAGLGPSTHCAQQHSSSRPRLSAIAALLLAAAAAAQQARPLELKLTATRVKDTAVGAATITNRGSKPVELGKV